MDDKGSDALQLAHYGLGVLQRERQMLPFLQRHCSSSPLAQKNSIDIGYMYVQYVRMCVLKQHGYL